MITRPKIWLIVSLITMAVCLGIIVAVPPVAGIDFKGGSLLELKTTLTADEVTAAIVETFELPVTAQATENNNLIVRTTALTAQQHDELTKKFQEKDAAIQELRFETVGPSIGAELRRKAWIAVSLSVVVIVIYLAYEFRHTGGLVSPWKFGVAAAVALVHDLLVVTASFSILGQTHGAPIDALFITAMLALGGYSVNDTIVLFNRLKQEWLARRSGNLINLLDQAVKLTLTRSLNTSIPILLTLITLLIFGGGTIRWFVVALTIGTITGMYSTIFVAPAWLWLLARKK